MSAAYILELVLWCPAASKLNFLKGNLVDLFVLLIMFKC